MAEGFHPPLEEYLEALYELEEEGAQLIQARLAERVGHSAPAVSEMVRRLRDAGYLEPGTRALGLSDSGRQVARSVVRKHRLAERLLTDIIGLPWHKAHLEAGRWEHVISDEVEQRLVEVLNNPTTCPHGNPIPGADSVTTDVSIVALTETNTGDRVRLSRVTERIETDLDSLTYLSEHGFVPGVEAVISSKGPDGTIVLNVGSATLALGQELAMHLYVTPSQG